MPLPPRSQRNHNNQSNHQHQSRNSQARKPSRARLERYPELIEEDVQQPQTVSNRKASRPTSHKNQVSKPRKKHHFLRNFLITVVVLLLVVGAVGAGFVALERYFVKRETQNLVSQVLPAASSTASSAANAAASAAEKAQIPATSPSNLAQKLNDYANTIIDKSGGLISSAKASVNGSTLTYNIGSSQLNGLTAGALVAANGDALQEMADKALTSMKQSGTANPQVVINLTNATGKVIKTLNYK